MCQILCCDKPELMWCSPAQGRRTHVSHSWVWQACRVIWRALRHQLRQVGSDGPRPAADVKDAHVRPQRRQQIAGAVGGGARRVRAEHALAVAMDISGGLWPGRGICVVNRRWQQALLSFT